MPGQRISPRKKTAIEIMTASGRFQRRVRQALEEAGIPMAAAEVTMIPQTYVELTDEKDIATFRRHWICWMMMTTFRMYTTTGTNRAEYRQMENEAWRRSEMI